ncbi:hypothetical protein GCM10009104_18650 [Marinobacterium maritimum]|uniref:PAS domain S-box-containing protein/diguanylate cyclase (GGDEF) domain-containing protein n=1 Tax=Marinobacterium maritimum TaxID=500162 RepID=A0ABN1I6A4_9GAMM
MVEHPDTYWRPLWWRLFGQGRAPLARLEAAAKSVSAEALDEAQFPRRYRTLANHLQHLIAHTDEQECSLRQNRQALQQLSAVLEQSPACIIITSLEGRILYVNPGFCRVTGYTEDEVRGQPVSMLKSTRTHADTFGQLWRDLQEKGEWHGELLNRRKSGQHYWVAASISVLRDESGRPDRYLSIQDDISLRKQYEAQLFYRSNYDLLTDLPNRQLMLDRLEQALDMAQRHHHRVAVFLVNLRQFRRVNQAHGHDVGDQLLCQAASRLEQVLSPMESLGRVGADEFLVVMPEVNRLQAVEYLGRCLLRQMEEPFHQNGLELRQGAAIGICLYPGDGDSAEVLLRNADAALQQVSRDRRGGCCFFRDEMNLQARQALEMERALHRALIEQQFELWFQPLLDLQTNQVRAVEALVRWRQPSGELVPPDQFIAHAEESGQIIELGRWVLKTAVMQVAGWQQVLGRPLGVAVNISPRQLRHHGFVDEVAELLSDSGLAEGALELEITESIFLDVDSESEVVSLMSQLRQLGVRLAIDDFGTGFSALGYLKRFPVDTLKIDREFVCDIHESVNAATLCQAIVWMARGLQLDVVAEGVECEAQLEMLVQSGADSAQGFYIAKPMVAPDVLLTIARMDRDGQVRAGG